MAVTWKNVYAEPLLFDWDGDRKIDILTAGDSARKTRTVVSCTRSGCSAHLLNEDVTSSAAMAEFHSNSFVDLDGDSNPDLLVSTVDHFELWLWRGPAKWELSKHHRSYPDGIALDAVGQSVFVDYDSSGRLSHLVPVKKKGGDEIRIWVPSSNTSTAGSWESVLKLNGTRFWVDNKHQKGVNAMMSLRSADVDQDGFPDFMAIYADPSDDKKRGIINMLNRPCDVQPCAHGRKLNPILDQVITKPLSQVTNMGFFDIRENGKMDVLITSGDLDQMNWNISALENPYAEDACFIKVITVSGLCSKDQCKVKTNIIEYG